ncbi:uncharacterized protein [Apostichopus japonicus]|uniref:uncharacterized protein isoform X1 n=2 Tax=Stichopus japonicus TaxID=307972 RepID=UPI003AB460BB
MALYTNLKSVFTVLWSINVIVVLGQSEPETEPPPVQTVRAGYCTRDYECSSSCGSLTSVTCSCHPACELFQDCCYNTIEKSNRCSKDTDTEIFLSEVLPDMRDYFQCATDVISQQKYWMVSKCPDTWTGLNECDVTGDDTDITVGRLEDNLSSIPVLSRKGLTYRNFYCALCHGEDLSDLSPWSFEAQDCEDTDIFKTATNLTVKDQIFLLREHCQSLSFLPPSDHPFYVLSVIPCFEITDDVIDTCDDNTASEDIRHKCSTIAAPISIGGYFKNTFCVECYYSSRKYIDYEVLEYCTAAFDREEIFPPVFAVPCLYDYETGETICPTPEPPPPPLVPISITFNFGGNSGGISITKNNERIQEISVTCNVGQVFDPLGASCKLLTCPSGYVLRSSLCVQLPNITTNSSEECNHYSIHIKADNVNFINNSCLENMETTFNCLPADLVLLLQANMEHYNTSCRMTSQEQVVLEVVTTSLEIIGSLLAKAGSTSSQNSDACTSLNIVEFLAYCPSKVEDPTLYCDSEWYSEPQWSTSGNITAGILFQNSSETTDVSQIKIRHLFQFSSTHGNISSEDILVQRCVFNSSEVSLCPLISLDSNVFLPLENESSVLVYAANISIQFTPDMYTIQQNGDIQVCNFLEASGTVVTYRFLPQYSQTQSILSTVGISLSVIALLLTLISYSVFPTLRTRLANIIIMTLCGCLVVAQLLLIFAGISTLHGTLCSVISGLGHFFWLTAFSSSSILGFLMNQTFSLRNQTLRGVKPSKKSIFLFILLCFVLPSIISGTLLILYSVDEDGIYGIVYGSNSGCWIGGPKINLYAFGIPVAVSVVINMIFFIHITVSICIQKRSSQRIRKTKEESHLRELVIYSKIFIILGLTWVIGFAAALFDKQWLWYLFIIFTSLQGLFIFLAFTVKSEIWGMWRKRLGMSSDSYISSSQGVYYQPGKGKKTSGLTASSTV